MFKRWIGIGILCVLGCSSSSSSPGTAITPTPTPEPTATPTPAPTATPTATPLPFVEQAYLKAPNAEATDQFGFSVAVDGDTAVVGAVVENSNQTTITNGTGASSDNSAASAGAVYVFKRTGTAWAQEAYLKPSNMNAGDYFGYSVAISGDTIVVGASQEDSSQLGPSVSASTNNSASNSGAAYVFKRTGTTWTQEAYLKAANTEANDDFGHAVAISGDTIVVGADLEDSGQTTITNGTTASGDNSAVDSGAAYVFKRTGTTWAQEAYLKASNASAGDNFGDAVAVNGDTIVVGANVKQTTYVFKRTGTTWAQEATLTATNADSSDDYGFSVAIDTDTIVVGAMLEDSNQMIITNGTTASSDNSAVNSGAAYVYKRTGTTWAQEAYLKASNADAGDALGWSVAVNGDTIVVGAVGESSNQTTITNGTTASSDNSASAAGAAYVFKRTGTNWIQAAYLKAPNADIADDYGRSVSVSNDTIVVGAEQEDSNQTTITNGTSASSNNAAAAAGAAYVIAK